jgi:ubiquinone/menaquinone biosynthesis C-methylase UbiE
MNRRASFGGLILAALAVPIAALKEMGRVLNPGGVLERNAGAHSLAAAGQYRRLPQ